MLYFWRKPWRLLRPTWASNLNMWLKLWWIGLDMYEKNSHQMEAPNRCSLDSVKVSTILWKIRLYSIRPVYCVRLIQLILQSPNTYFYLKCVHFEICVGEQICINSIGINIGHCIPEVKGQIIICVVRLITVN